MSTTYVFAHGKARVGAGLSAPDVLCRYLGAAKFIDFLENNTLFFCRGDQFEDKFEGSFTQSIFAWPHRGEDASDFAIVNAHAGGLTAKAQGALSYQVPL